MSGPSIRTIGERGVISRIRRRAGRSPSVPVGIGDDAAVIRTARGERLLFASDMLVEGVHFRRKDTPPDWIGWKALAVNVSDIAAMGGQPRWAVVSLGVPPQTPLAFTDGLSRGLLRCARRYGVALVGGDTVRAPQVVIDVAILGEPGPRGPVLRQGAGPGDALFVTGRLGGSLASGRHARVTPRVREAQALVRAVPVRAMIDLSDGLAADLGQLSRASRVALRVEAARIPRQRGATLAQALFDGEDFELLFAVAARDAARVPRRLGACAVTRIGRVLRRGAGVELIDARGRCARLAPRGFSHF